jgi:UDP-glucuronate 4-epimerase
MTFGYVQRCACYLHDTLIKDDFGEREMKVLLTGSAGFIGSALTLKLLNDGYEVIGIDNLNDYYDPSLKRARLERYIDHPSYINIEGDIADRSLVEHVFQAHRPQRVVNLAAQAGVRHSIKDPHSYVSTNVVGFLNILEGCRHNDVDHLVYASSSSVYGANTSMPFSTHDSVNHPLSMYAATKKSNEMMAHSYSSLFQLPTTGLRFFTVYGPWGRPDMAAFLFARDILEGKPIDVFNHGKHCRDFTYIDDVVEGVARILEKPPTQNTTWEAANPDPSSSGRGPFKIYNIGNSRRVELLHYIEVLEQNLGRKALRNFLPLQPGDVPDTFADVEDFVAATGYRPSTSTEDGVRQFVEWYLDYYHSDEAQTRRAAM